MNSYAKGWKTLIFCVGGALLLLAASAHGVAARSWLQLGAAGLKAGQFRPRLTVHCFRRSTGITGG